MIIWKQQKKMSIRNKNNEDRIRLDNISKITFQKKFQKLEQYIDT